jgi:adenylylsulfate kinase-like enzyme
MIPVLWLCGPPGVGKTAVAWEVYRRLLDTGVAAAYVDADQVGICSPDHVDDPARHALKAPNVGALRTNYADAGAGCLIVSGTADPRHGPDTAGLGGGAITVCRLRADAGALLVRLGGRRGWVVEPNAVVRDVEAFDRSTFTGWCIDTTELAVDQVADDVLARIGELPRHRAGVRRHTMPADRAGSDPAGGAVLWLCGPTGVGKSTVGFALYLAVLRSGVDAAYVDLDQVGFFGTASIEHDLRARNLAALWTNFRTEGANALVVVGPVAATSDVDGYERLLPAATFTLCRLHAGEAELTARMLTRRDGGSWAQPGDPLRGRSTQELLDLAARSVADGQPLERLGVGLRFAVDGLAIDDVVARILTQTGWPVAR